MRAALRDWSGGRGAGRRKLRMFDDRMLQLALRRLTEEAPLSEALA